MPNTSEVIQLAFIPPSLLTALIVSLLFGRGAIRTIYSTDPRTPSELFILGVTVYFSGLFFNYLWWGGFWLSHFSQADGLAGFFLQHGAVSNILTRHIPTIIAGSLIVAAAKSFSSADQVKF